MKSGLKSAKTTKEGQVPKEKRRKRANRKNGTSDLLEQLSSCKDKENLKILLQGLLPIQKQLLVFYLTQCFIIDIYNRQLKHRMALLAARETLYSAIFDPTKIASHLQWTNVLVSYFTEQLIIFIKAHSTSIWQKIDEMEQEGTLPYEISLENLDSIKDLS